MFIMDVKPINGEQVGLITCSHDEDAGVLVVLRVGDGWLPRCRMVEGRQLALPPCFSIEETLVEGLDAALAAGKPMVVAS